VSLESFSLVIFLGLLSTSANGAPAAKRLSPLIVSWLAAQTNIQTWSADFVQTRTLKSLTQPLTAAGHVWFAAPNRFRWELGHPAQTIAVRAKDELLVIYPKLKRVERFPLVGETAGPWRDALGLLQAGFPRSQSELESQYNILKEAVVDQTCEVVLQPKSSGARRMMPEINIIFDIKDFSLRGTELHMVDGSTMRNDFQNATINPAIDAQKFSPEIPSDFKVVEPLKQH